MLFFSYKVGHKNVLHFSPIAKIPLQITYCTFPERRFLNFSSLTPILGNFTSSLGKKYSVFPLARGDWATGTVKKLYNVHNHGDEVTKKAEKESDVLQINIIFKVSTVFCTTSSPVYKQNHLNNFEYKTMMRYTVTIWLIVYTPSQKKTLPLHLIATYIIQNQF